MHILVSKGYEDEGIEGQNAFKARSFLRAVKALDVYPDVIHTVNHVKAVSNIWKWNPDSLTDIVVRLTALAMELHEGLTKFCIQVQTFVRVIVLLLV